MINNRLVQSTLSPKLHYMTKFYLFFLLPVITMLFFSQCKKQDQPDGEPALSKGIVTGKVVAANNVTPIRSAHVFIADGDKFHSTFTDVNGVFSLEAAAGSRQLNIQTGNGHMFRTVMDVTVLENQTVTLPGASVKLNQVANLAYVPGNYDKIEQILVDTLGYTATSITTTSFNNLNFIAQYDAIFINCGDNGMMPMNAARDLTLGNYVANGGSLYVSDWAVSCLVGSSFTPGCVTPKPGGFLPDSLLCTEKSGNQMTIPLAPVVSPSLQAYLNKNTMSVVFDLGSWERVNLFNSNFWEVMVTESAAANSPLLLRSNLYSNNSRGTVNVGSNNNNNWVTICHKPAGSNPVTITIPSNAVAAHLAHGDSLGECGNEDGSGRIYFTTFHNAHNGQVGSDVKNILQYMILNL
jgi:hypothetical protein